MRMRTIAILILLAGCGEEKKDDVASTSSSVSTSTSMSSSPSTSTSASSSVPSAAIDAKAVCDKLAAAGFGSGCKQTEPHGLASAAWLAYDLELVEPKGKTCGVFSFKRTTDFDATTKAFDKAAALAGPHRYGNAKALVFVQCNKGMERSKGEELEKVISSL